MISLIIMASFENDYKTGKSSEDIVYELLKQCKTLKKLKKAKDMYCKYDFYNNDCEIELKTRNNTFDKYPTTLMPVSKVIRDKDHKKTIIFMFKFNEDTEDIKQSIYYIKYDVNEFENIKRIQFKRNPRLGITDKVQEYFEIPTNRLKSFYDLELFGIN